MMTDLSTTRLLLRPWSPDDASELYSILVANQSHLAGWIPDRISRVAPIPELAKRLRLFAADFDANREWRFAIISRETRSLLGEADLFSRDASRRVPYDESDRAEIGYWLRADVTGMGYATEAVRALIDRARTLTRFRSVEIRCAPRNLPSAAIPSRLGFSLTSAGATDVHSWSLPL